jgi:hypothetical protein
VQQRVKVHRIRLAEPGEVAGERVHLVDRVTTDNALV